MMHGNNNSGGRDQRRGALFLGILIMLPVSSWGALSSCCSVGGAVSAGDADTSRGSSGNGDRPRSRALLVAIIFTVPPRTKRDHVVLRLFPASRSKSYCDCSVNIPRSLVTLKKNDLVSLLSTWSYTFFFPLRPTGMIAFPCLCALLTNKKAKQLPMARANIIGRSTEHNDAVDTMHGL